MAICFFRVLFVFSRSRFLFFTGWPSFLLPRIHGCWLSATGFFAPSPGKWRRFRRQVDCRYQTLLWTQDRWNGFHSECVSDFLHPWFHEHHILRCWFHYAHLINLIIKHHCARYRKLTSQFQSFLLCFLCITNLDLMIQFEYHSSSFLLG